MEAALRFIVSLILLLSFLLGLCACAVGKKDDGEDNESVGNEDQNTGGTNQTPTIIVPEYKDYGRNTIDFKDIVYSRPSVADVVSDFDAVTAAIEANELTLTEQIALISSLEDELSYMKTMYSVAEIYNHKDSSVEYWQKEFEYLSTNYPLFTQAVENLLVACAKSPLKTEFENEYFEYSLDEYADGGIYTDEVVGLMSEEARLESEYSSLSTANVEIVYTSVSGVKWEGTVNEVLAMAAEKYGLGTKEYENVALVIHMEYEQALEKKQIPLLTELFKIRRLIADELGYDSYVALAYESLGYDYSANDMLGLLSDVCQYVTPVASSLEHEIFYSYFQKNIQPRVDTVTLINSLYEVYSGTDAQLKDAYSYMLQHGLYDVAAVSDNRFEGAFTSYLDSNNSPYLFMSASGFAKDYLTLAHEFGHFYDGFVNYGNDASLDVSEISSQGLELLTLLGLKSRMKVSEYEYLEYYAMYSMINSVLITQSFYSAFEHIAYDIEYDDVSEESLTDAVGEAFEYILGPDFTVESSLSYVLIPHIALYPCYVESYVTSGIVSLEIFFAESYRTGSAGSGLEMYNRLISRGASNLGLEGLLESAGLTSPFASGQVKNIANNLYYQIIGKNYYTVSDNLIGVA